MRSDFDRKILRRHPAIAALRPEDFDRLSAEARLSVFEAGDSIPSTSGRVRFLIEGEVEAHIRSEGVQVLAGLDVGPAILNHLVVDPLAQGWMLRARSLATVVAVEREAFETLVGRDLTFAAEVYRDAQARFGRIAHLVARLVSPREEQIMDLLWELSGPPESPGDVRTAKTTTVSLGRALAIDRRTVHRNLNKLEADGRIDRRRGKIGLIEERRRRDAGLLERLRAPVWRSGPEGVRLDDSRD